MQHALLDALIHAVPFGVLAEDATRRIIAANQRFCDLFGVPGDPARLIGNDFAAMAKHAAQLFVDAERFMATTPPSREELALRDGRRLQRDHVSVEGGVQLWLFTDVSEKHAAEEANEAKTRFLGTMSHEMRTPLSVLMGMAELLAEDRTLTSEQAEYVGRILRNAGSLRHMIEDILQFSKLEGGAIVLREGTFSPALLLDDVADALRTRATDKGLEIRVQSDGLPSFVDGDANRLRQVLVNLMNNAIKFTEKGSVTVRARGETRADLRRIRYAVEDTGVGIPDEMQSRVFERFVRVQGKGVPLVTGTGLGLSISQALVKLMGGSDIHIDSEVGRGSVFSFYLDHAAPSRAADEGASEPPVTIAAGQRALLCEDDEDNRILLTRHLEKCGFEVVAVADGQEALDRAGQRDLDLVVADLSMPNVDGLELTAALRERGETTPIIMISAHAQAEYRARAEAAGVNAFLTKPIRGRELRRALHEVLPSQPPTSERVVHVEADVMDLLPGYLERKRGDSVAVKIAVAAGDFDTATTIGHRLKGSGAAYGFDRISELGAELEAAAKVRDADAAIGLADALADYVSRVVITPK